MLEKAKKNKFHSIFFQK